MGSLLLNEETEVRRYAPLPSVRRLPMYLRVLKAMLEEGRAAVSCTMIAADLRADPTQVRKDLAITGIVGKPKVGYETALLIDSIEEFLGWNNSTDAFLVGVGSLGTAILGHREFANLGLNIVAAFDASPSKVGRRVHGHEIMAMDRLRGLARRMHIHIGVLTVPADAAQKVAGLMADSGIIAVWNFTPTRLDLPGDMIVERADLSSSLAALTSRLRGAVRDAGEDANKRRR
jgi:redox-sensing transcriptional repressor